MHSVTNSSTVGGLKLSSDNTRNRKTDNPSRRKAKVKVSPQSSIMSPPSAATALSLPKIVTGDYGYVLEDVPHLTDYIPDLPVCSIAFISHPHTHTHD